MALSVSDAPELILLDVGLQDMDGYEVCRRLRDNPATRDIPVIFLSNHDSREEVLQGFRVGGQDYVLKNAEITELMVRIGTHLQLYRQKAALESALEQNRIQNEKMAALGKLAAGVAHEINNPMGEIVLRSWHDEAFVYASVTDNGSGMTQEILERIFDPFYTTKPEGEGTGLGLNISHDIVAKHHGELLVESAVEVGTTFTVKLPQTRKLP